MLHKTSAFSTYEYMLNCISITFSPLNIISAPASYNTSGKHAVSDLERKTSNFSDINRPKPTLVHLH